MYIGINQRLFWQIYDIVLKLLLLLNLSTRPVVRQKKKHNQTTNSSERDAERKTKKKFTTSVLIKFRLKPNGEHHPRAETEIQVNLFFFPFSFFKLLSTRNESMCSRVSPSQITGARTIFWIRNLCGTFLKPFFYTKIGNFFQQNSSCFCKVASLLPRVWI